MSTLLRGDKITIVHFPLVNQSHVVIVSIDLPLRRVPLQITFALPLTLFSRPKICQKQEEAPENTPHKCFGSKTKSPRQNPWTRPPVPSPLPKKTKASMEFPSRGLDTKRFCGKSLILCHVLRLVINAALFAL